MFGWARTPSFALASPSDAGPAMDQAHQSIEILSLSATSLTSQPVYSEHAEPQHDQRFAVKGQCCDPYLST